MALPGRLGSLEAVTDNTEYGDRAVRWPTASKVRGKAPDNAETDWVSDNYRWFTDELRALYPLPHDPSSRTA